MKWLHWPRKSETAPARAFCFPHAGTGVSAYPGWAECLLPELDTCIVVPPGRELRFREPSFTDLPLLVDEITNAMLPHLDKPFVLIGHSFGALVAFEVARTLRRVARLPEVLFVSAAPAPQCGWPHQNLHCLSESDFISELRRLYDGIPQAVLDDPELRSLVLPALRADITVVETYRYKPEQPLECPISAIGGLHDRVIRPHLVQEWRHQTSGRFRCHEISGGHFYLRTARTAMSRIVLADWGGAKASCAPLAPAD